ncbi:MAG: glycosyltransferase family 2 protein [Bacteroidota bacterium]
MSDFLVFIPVYNEERSIRAIIHEIRNTTDHVDILIIDDGSTDDTTSILEKTENIQVIRHSQNQGYGKTLIDGFRYADEKGYKYVITIDSDKQHQPREISKFISATERYDSDIITGSRYLNVPREELKKAPEDRVRINRRITAMINNLTGFQLTDSFCGFKLYKVKALRQLSLTETGYGLPLQLWIQAWKKGLTVTEIPVQLIYFDHTPRQTSYWKNMFRRYRYYLRIIQKETESHEYNDYSSAS